MKCLLSVVLLLGVALGTVSCDDKGTGPKNDKGGGKGCCSQPECNEKPTPWVPEDACAGACADEEEVCSDRCGAECARNYFEKVGTCSVVRSPSDSMNISTPLGFVLPVLETTVVTEVCRLSGLDNLKSVQIKKDKQNRYVVITIKLSEFVCESPDSRFAFHIACSEPKVFVESITCIYRDPVITAVIELVDGKITDDALVRAKYSTHFDHDNSDLFIGDFSSQTDPFIAGAMSKMAENKGLLLAEIYEIKSRLMFMIVVTARICQFGGLYLLAYDTTVLDNIHAHGGPDNALVWPCGACADESCARAWLGERGACVPARPDPTVCRTDIDIHIPACNSTVVREEHVLTNVTAKIKTFFWNKDTDNLVLCLEFPGVKFYAPVTTLSVYRKYDTPATTTGYTTATYAPQLTVVIPTEGKCEDMRVTRQSLQKAFARAYFPTTPCIDVDPKWRQCKNPAVQAAVCCLHEHTALVASEIFSTEAHSYFLYWLRGVCDFGLPLYSGHFQHNAQRF